MKSCLECKRFSKCKDVQKSRSYSCSKFRAVNVEDSLSHIFGFNDLSGPDPLKEIIIPGDDKENELGLVKMLDEVLKPENRIPPDLKVDDRDIKEFPNFFEFAISPNGLDVSPYAKQLAIATFLFAEFCPRCSSPDFSIKRVPKKYKSENFPDKVTFLKYGVCPKCKVTKSELVFSGELNFYQELAACVGQRCVTGDTIILTEDGLVEIEDYAVNRPYEYSDFNKKIHTGKKLRNASKFYKAKPEKLLEVILKNGYAIKGTDDHPILTLDGFKNLSDLTHEDYVKINVGQHNFGSTLVDLQAVSDRARIKVDKYIYEMPKTNKKQFIRARKTPGISSYTQFMCVELAEVIGYVVSEGSESGLSNINQSVLDKCYSTLSNMFGREVVTKFNEGIRWEYDVVFWLRELFEIDEIDEIPASAYQKVPRCILEAPEYIQSAFLMTLFEGDVYAHKNYISYSTISPRLSNQVSSMLSNFGIIHVIKGRKTWESNGTENQIAKDGFSLNIIGEVPIEKYRDLIGFSDNIKNQKFNKPVITRDHTDHEVPFYYEKCPDPMKREFFDLLSDIQQRMNAFINRENSGIPYCISTLYKDGLHKVFMRTKESLNVCLTKKKVKAFILPILNVYSSMLTEKEKNLLNYYLEFANDSNTYYSKIKTITKSTRKYVTYDMCIPEDHCFVSNGLISHNSGKSAMISGMYIPYVIHKFLKLQNPSEVFGLLKTSNTLVGTLVALTFAKAITLLWMPIKSILNSKTGWFSEYRSMLDHYQEVYGEEIYKLLDTFVYFKHRNLLVSPAGPNKRTLRGDTRAFTCIDELGWFFNDKSSDKKEKQSADEVYTSLDRSLLTVRAASLALLKKGYNNIPTGYAFNISSPSDLNDKIMSLIRKHEGSREVLTYQAATWNFNPSLNKSNFKKEFRENYIKAMRDYGAEPPRNTMPFINDKLHVLKSIGTLKNRVTYSYYEKTNSSGVKQKYARIENIKTGSTIFPSILAIDAGYSNNSFSIAVGHIERDSGRKIIFDTFVEIAPDRDRNVLNYSLIAEHILYPLITQLNVKYVLADRWQSIKILSDIDELFRIGTKTYSLKYSDFIYSRDYFVDDETTIFLPKLEMGTEEIDQINYDNYPHCFRGKPISHLFFQCMTVTDNGKSVDKGLNLTDDLMRAMFLALHFLLDDEFTSKYLKDSKRGTASLGAMSGLSTGITLGNRTERGDNPGVGASASKSGSGTRSSPSTNVGVGSSKLR